MRKLIVLTFFILLMPLRLVFSGSVLMDKAQRNHLKAYGYWMLTLSRM